MKPSPKIFLFVLFFLLTIQIHSQGYLPIFKDVNKWCSRGLYLSYLSFPYDLAFAYSGYNDNTDSTIFVKDTFITGKSYKVILNPSFGSPFYKNVVTYLREDTATGMTWYLDTNNIEHVLYDFKLIKDDSINIIFTEFFSSFPNLKYAPVSGIYIVDSVWSLNVYGASRKIISLKLKTTTTHLYNKLLWIEGIGSNTIPIYINTPALNETVYDINNNYFLHNYIPNFLKQAVELTVIERSTGPLFVKPNWDCNKRRNITTGIFGSLPKSNIQIKNNIIYIPNYTQENLRISICNMEGKVLFDKEYFNSEINIDELKTLPTGLIIIKVTQQNNIYIFKHFNF